jgi:hypothetical protein
MTNTDFRRRLNDALAGLLPRDPRYAYWETNDGWQFLYTTERGGDGKFWSAVLVPHGRGARSGNPSYWRTRREVHHRLRRQAKARAYRLYQDHLSELAGRTPGLATEA